MENDQGEDDDNRWCSDCMLYGPRSMLLATESTSHVTVCVHHALCVGVCLGCIVLNGFGARFVFFWLFETAPQTALVFGVCARSCGVLVVVVPYGTGNHHSVWSSRWTRTF